MICNTRHAVYFVSLVIISFRLSIAFERKRFAPMLADGLNEGLADDVAELVGVAEVEKDTELVGVMEGEGVWDVETEGVPEVDMVVDAVTEEEGVEETELEADAEVDAEGETDADPDGEAVGENEASAG